MRLRSFGFHLITLCLMIILKIPTGVAACPGIRPDWAHWVWSPVEYVNNSSYADSVFALGAENWNYLAINVNLSSHTVWNDVTITDVTSLPGGALGDALVFSHASSECNNHRDDCGICYNSTTAYYGRIHMNTVAISSTAGQFGVAPDTMARHVVAHEFGHILGLDHLNESPNTCAAITSVMDLNVGNRAVCGYTSGSCDQSVVATIYPNPVAAYCNLPCEYICSLRGGMHASTYCVVSDAVVHRLPDESPST